jgi:capsular polysaccharide biosynthesis protein
MSLSELLSLARRRGWIALLVAALAAASAFAFSRIQPTVYQSSVTISVTPSRSDLGLTESLRRIIDNYVIQAYSRVFAQDVITELDLDMTADELLGNTTIDSDELRLIMTIDVRNENGDLANDIARTWAGRFVDWRDEQNQRVRREDQIDAAMVDQPTYSIYSPRTSINTLAGGILGLLVGAVVVFVLEYRDASIVRSRLDLERGLGLTVLGVLPSTGNQ